MQLCEEEKKSMHVGKNGELSVEIRIAVVLGKISFWREYFLNKFYF